MANSNSDTELSQPTDDDPTATFNPSRESSNKESATHRANDRVQVALNKTNVYIRDDDYAWIPARLISQDEHTAKVSIPQYEFEDLIMSDGGKTAVGYKSAVVRLKDYPNRTLPLQNTGKDGSLVEFEDMVDLPCLHEAAVLYNLKARHVKGLPYCRVGDIMFAVNPYQWLTNLYDKQAQQHYAKKIVWGNPKSDPRTNLRPHIYEVSALCYRDLAMKKEDQSILVCGESGAGKTESAKICINHIALVQRDSSKIDEEESLMVRQILDSNPLLEAFGNAKTRRNDNSSRFSRYTTLQFNHLPQQNGGLSRAELVGSVSEVFLLEKSRVVRNEEHVERSFHAFYQLVAAPNDDKERIWKGLVEKSAESFKYLGPTPEVKVDGLSDAEWFQKVADMLSRFGIVDESYLMLYRAICACLQLGNLEFAPDKSDDEKTIILSKEELTSFCELIGCDEKVMELALTERTIKTGGEEYKVPMKHDESKATADGFAKEIYAKTFLWLVRSINDVTSAEKKKDVDGGSMGHGVIGVLDIFGFQSFPVNGFEELCINYCNEKLHQKFIKDIFASVQEEYKAEGLNLPGIRYDDNSDVLGLIEGKIGLIKQLNEECVRPNGNDAAFVSKALKSNRPVPCLIQKKIMGPLDFGIHHYAGPVGYRAHDFVVRNNDSLPGDVKKAAESCANNEILSKHLSNNLCANTGSGVEAPIVKRARSNLSAHTVMTQLKNQLKGLMSKLEKTKARYIRCIKPNTVKKKLVMQHITTLEQLRAASCGGSAPGSITLFRSAYPSKLKYAEVKNRYYDMLTEDTKQGGYSDAREEVEHICDQLLKQFESAGKDGVVMKGYAVGKTKCYFKSGCLESLEAQRTFWRENHLMNSDTKLSQPTFHDATATGKDSRESSRTDEVNRHADEMSNSNSDKELSQPTDDEPTATFKPSSESSNKESATQHVNDMAQVTLNKDHVYIRDDDYGWVPARWVSQDETTAKVAILQYEAEEFIMSDCGRGATGFKSAVVKLKDYPNRTLPLQNTGKDGSLVEFEDMLDLPCLHEAAVLYNLKARHVKGLPYCRIGDIIIAVNPYRWLTELYDKQAQQHYAKKIVWENPKSDPRTNLRPHIYEVSALCYRDLAMKKEDQSILVCGESGAGKTESAKICIYHIALVQRDPSKIDKEESLMVRQILDSNPLLEAFGNAKTRRNDNSSRFSRYTTLQFNHLQQQNGGLSRAELVGSLSEVFLLEKSRVVYNEDIERSFHAFYQLVAAPNDAKERIWKGLVEKSAESFKYLGPAPEVKVDGLSDAVWFQKVADMSSRFGIVHESYLMLYRAICACLQLGNLEFAPNKSDDEKTIILSKEELTSFCELIGCDEKVMELALTERTIKTGGEEYKVPMKHDESKATADGFAKEIYAKTFLWLVRSINAVTSAEKKKDVDGGSMGHGVIGVLDIFGFQSFPVNGFEELCINYCNEKLQYKFTKDTSFSVIEEYEGDALNFLDVRYDDNSDVLGLIEGKLGLVKHLNEECVRPNGNDAAFVSKALKSNRPVPCLIQKKTMGPLDFGIHHYAGPVVYRAHDFVVRNNDSLPGDVKKAAESCANNEILSKHLSNNLCVNTGSGVVPRSNRSAHTVMTQFKNQLNDLMSKLEKTKSRYIRCIKPNTVKKKLVMQHITTLEQLRSSGCIASITLFRSAANHGADVKIADNDGWTTLMWASNSGLNKIVKLLLEKGADVNIVNKNGETALMWASLNGHNKVAKRLLEKGADAAIADKDGWTALMGASLNGHDETVKLLLERGADITATNKDGETALTLAFDKGHNEIVKRLLENGADVNATNKDGRTALIRASLKGHDETVKLLLEQGADVEITGKDGRTALMWASLNGHNKIAKRLLEKGADAAIADKDGWTALMGASLVGHDEAMQLLLEKGAAVAATNKNGETALSIAFDKGHNEIVKRLLENGADVNATNKEGWTALIWASLKGHDETVKLLLEQGADVEITGKDGRTALMGASLKGYDEIVKLLLEMGAAVTATNKNGETALTLAFDKGHNEVVKCLLKNGADVTATNKEGWTALIWASLNGHGETVNLLLEKSADVTATNKDGEAALTLAFDKGHNEIVKLLLEKGADIPATNKEGWTALMYASINGCNEIVKRLLEKGADVTATNKDGDTALTLASKRGHNEIVKLLMEKGANVTTVNKNGETALSIAFDQGFIDILGLLLEKDPNTSRSNGQTLLHLACLQNKKAHVQKLLELGINKDILDNNDHTALFYAAEKGYADIVDLLMMQNTNGNKTDERRCVTGYDSNYTNWHSYYEVKDGRTPLFVGAQNGHQNAVAVLLQRRADPYLCNHESKIPRDVSVAYGPIQQLFRIHDFFDKRDKGEAYRTEYLTCNWRGGSTKNKESVPPLEDIIHDIVKYPNFADKFFEIYQENREIVNWLDEDGRTVRQVACKECREATLFMGQYDMDEQPMYESPTCKIYNGLDFGGRGEPTLKQPIPVAMKMMENEEHYLNEIRARRKDDGSPRFSSEFVTPYLAAYRADKNPDFAKAGKTWNINGNGEKIISDFFIAMELGGRNLMESMNAENLSAKHKDLQRREILLTLVKIFVYLHKVGYIHGDIKPHNVVRHMGDSVTPWKAIDFDACTKIGDVVGLKLTTGSAPPEMTKIETGGSKGESKVILRQPGGDLDEDDLVKADPSFDVWSFGILMYQLVTGRSFFHADLQGNVDEAGLQDLANLTQPGIDKKLEGVEDANARDVLQDILLLNPKERPTMSKIEEYSYFHPSKESDPKGPLTFAYTSTSQVIPKSVTKLIIGEDIQEITKGVCSGNGRLEEVDTTKAHSLEIVGEKAFSSCRALEEFQCPPSVKAIRLDAFHECVKLQDFTFSKAQALELIGDRAFYGCRALTTFKCPSNIRVIGKHAFFGCESLLDVDLSEAHALESIEGRAFSFCAAVQKVVIPKNVTVVGEGFLHECDALESLLIAGENPILHINVLLRLPETKRELISMDSIVEMYSTNPVKKSELSGESSKVGSLLQEVKDGYVESVKRSDDPIRKISKRNGWVQFLSAHANDSKEDCIQKLTSFLENEATISVVRMLADATDPLGRVAKMIAPEHIRKVFEKRLFFLGRYDIAKGPPIHKSATCMVMKAKDAQMSDYYKEMFEEFVQGRNSVDKDKFTEVLQKMKLISYSETNIKELFHKVDVDKSGTVSKEEFVDFCMAELGHDVVLKFMRNKDQYRRELNGREGLDPKFVVGCIRNHDTSTNRELIISLKDTIQSQEEDSGEILEKHDEVFLNDYCYVIVMPFGDRNLATISQSERPGPLAIRKMMQEVGEALCHLHKNKIVHGDLKMLNVVRSNGRLSLIDLDASGRIGKDFVGSKFSSGVVPPEMLYELKNVKELNAYKDYISKGGSKGEKEKREPVFTRDTVDRQCFVVRSFWEKEVLEQTNDKWTGKTLTSVKPDPILDGLPYSEEVRQAAPAFDVWSFGVLLYRLLTRDPLFHVNDEDDIKKGDEMKKLYQWSDSDLKSTIESDVADPHARQLLQNILRSDPSERWTMEQVLNDDYFKVDLVKNMKEVHEKLSRIEKISLDNHHLMIREFARVHSSLQQIQRFQVEANKLLGQIMDGQAVPRYFLILPQPDSIDVPNKMTFVRFRRKVKDATNPDTYIKQQARLCFICPLSLQPVVDASGQAICFDIEVPQDWVRKYGPALLIGMKVAQVAMSVGRCFGLPLPSLSGAEDALAERSEVFSKLQEMVVSGLGKEGEDEEGGTIADCLISSLTDKLEESVSKDNATSKMIRNRLQDSYDGIEKLIPAEKDIRDCGLIEATYVNPETPEDCISEYVHPEWKDVFVKLGKRSLEMSMEELEMEKAKLDSSLSTPATSRTGESKQVSNDMPSTETETGGESKSVKQPSLGEAALNQRSSTSVYADEVVEEVSMSDSNILEIPNHPTNDRLYGKMENMEHMLGEVLQNQQQTNVERMLGEVLQNQQQTNVAQKLDKIDSVEHMLGEVLQNQQEKNVEQKLDKIDSVEHMLGEVLQNQQETNVERMLGEVLQNQQQTNVAQKLDKIDSVEHMLGEVLQNQQEKNVEQKLDKIDSVEHMLGEVLQNQQETNVERMLGEVLQNQHMANSTSSTTVENNVVIFHGWLSKQSREHSYRWQDRYFEIFNNGDVAYYPKGVHQRDLEFGVKLFQRVQWSKIAVGGGRGEDKLELRSWDSRYVLATVRDSKRDTLKLDEWLEMGKSWMERNPSVGFAENERNSTSSKPRASAARITAAGSVDELHG